MYKILLYVNTIKYLKLSQIFYRFKRILIRPKSTDVYKYKALSRPDNWLHVSLYPEKIDKNFNANFLNFSKKLNLPADWNCENPSKLWLYNLHYFEDLLSENAIEKKSNHIALLKLWNQQNQQGKGVGWEPYPTSLRIVNVIKAWLGGLDLDSQLIRSIFIQSSFLSNDLEKHLLGNHYFVNLKALFFAGIIFKNYKWLRLSQNELINEMHEQILDDGGNFELTPMYHSLMLVDLLDLFNLCKAYPELVSQRFINAIESYIPKMLNFMEAMSHPDGGVSFFNDSVDGIAPDKSKIETYARKLGFKIYEYKNMKLINLRETGYICSLLNGNKLIFDASQVGPDYIPGHAHADTLSFEFSIGSERVFVNSGISEYGLKTKRLQQRQTKSHNTVEVDGKDSSQVWSGFRVAKRARVIDRYAKIDNGHIIMHATHDGYKSILKGCLHSRELDLSEDKLIINDFLDGKYSYAKSYLHFHPKLLITLDRNLLTIKGQNFIIYSDVKDKNAKLIDSLWHPEFGIELPNKKLEMLIDNISSIKFTWEKF